jgi:hypothetical protein
MVTVGCSQDSDSGGKKSAPDALTPVSEAPSSGISVMTDRLEYRQGEVIKVTIINDTDGCILSHIHSLTPVFSIEYVERKNPDGSWQQLFAYCQPPKCEYDIDAPGKITHGETASFEWHPQIYIEGGPDAEQLAAGTYRLATLYQECAKAEWKSVRTNEFTIK